MHGEAAIVGRDDPDLAIVAAHAGLGLNAHQHSTLIGQHLGNNRCAALELQRVENAGGAFTAAGGRNARQRQPLAVGVIDRAADPAPGYRRASLAKSLDPPPPANETFLTRSSVRKANSAEFGAKKA